MNDKDTQSPAAESIRVSIFDQIYSLRSQSGGEHVERVARLVDERMRQISSHITTYDVSRIAVLAALNIADEMETLKAYYEQEIQTLLAQSASVPETHNDNNGGGSEATEGDEPPARETSERRSWFEAIFDADEEAPVKNRGERLSSQVSAKLQSLRPSDSETNATDADETDERR